MINDWGFADVDNETGKVAGHDWLFAGGDLGGVAGTTVEATNDGKVASW